MHSNAKRPPRFLLMLVGLLLCSNLATALVAYLVIERLDERYSRELTTAVPGLHEVMLLAQDSTNTHRAAGNLLLARDEAETNVITARLQDARQTELNRINEILTKGPSQVGDALEPLLLASSIYNQALQEYLLLIENGKKEEARAYRLDKLRPIFELYQNRLREESVRLNFEALRTSGELSAQAKARKGILLGLGGWPLAAMLFMLVAFGVLGGLVWRQLHHIESEEKKLRTDREF
jgi:hypothetical protein